MSPDAEGLALAAAAKGLVGAPFRLHGRDPATGLDCVGVLAEALARIGRKPRLPTGYTLRTMRTGDFAPVAKACGLTVADGPIRPGDILLVRPAAGQLHLMIAATHDRFIHAHAGRRRVIEGILPDRWPAIARWRPATS